MTRRGWRAADTARALGVDDSLISRWRSGKQVPDVESCRSIADHLDLPMLTILVAVGHITATEAGQKSMAALTPAELSTDEVVAELIELSAEIQRRIADLRSEVDKASGADQTKLMTRKVLWVWTFRVYRIGERKRRRAATSSNGRGLVGRL